MRHHEEPNRVEPQVAAQINVLSRHVRLGAMCRYSNGFDTAIRRHSQMINSANARK